MKGKKNFARILNLSIRSSINEENINRLHLSFIFGVFGMKIKVDCAGVRSQDFQ